MPPIVNRYTRLVGIDHPIVQEGLAGFEMGGHAPSKAVHTYVLVPNLTEAVDVPVLLTGGARDGRSGDRRHHQRDGQMR